MFNHLSPTKKLSLSLLFLSSAIATASLLSIATFRPAIAQNPPPTSPPQG